MAILSTMVISIAFLLDCPSPSRAHGWFTYSSEAQVLGTDSTEILINLRLGDRNAETDDLYKAKEAGLEENQWEQFKTEKTENFEEKLPDVEAVAINGGSNEDTKALTGTVDLFKENPDSENGKKSQSEFAQDAPEKGAETIGKECTSRDKTSEMLNKSEAGEENETETD